MKEFSQAARKLCDKQMHSSNMIKNLAEAMALGARAAMSIAGRMITDKEADPGVAEIAAEIVRLLEDK